MKELLFSRFDINGNNILDGIFRVDGNDIKKNVEDGNEGLKTIYEDMIIGTDVFGIMTYGNGEWDIFTQDACVDGFYGLANYAFHYLETNKLFNYQNTITFRGK